MRSSSHPAIGAETPIASDSPRYPGDPPVAPAESLEQRGQKDRRGVITTTPEKEQRDEEADRYNPRLALPFFHGCLRNEMCGRIIDAAAWYPDYVGPRASPVEHANQAGCCP
jgi:hypothetical protein